MEFIHDDFLLTTKAARRLYHQYAAAEPILDYHSHLSPGDIAADRRFNNLFEIWLEGDHYKWRAMRANGVLERYCTGDAPPFEKFLAWARTVPFTQRQSRLGFRKCVAIDCRPYGAGNTKEIQRPLSLYSG